MIANATCEIVRRSHIHKAAYNPRGRSAKPRAISLHEFGLVIPLVWNRQTDNLVGGHRRLDILDAENMPHGGDYKIEVSVVDLSLEREKVLSVALNKIGGEFDDDKLQSLLDDLDGKLDLDLTSLVIDEERKSERNERRPKKPSRWYKKVGGTFNQVRSEKTERNLARMKKRTNHSAKAYLRCATRSNWMREALTSQSKSQMAR